MKTQELLKQANKALEKANNAKPSELSLLLKEMVKINQSLVDIVKKYKPQKVDVKAPNVKVDSPKVEVTPSIDVHPVVKLDYPKMIKTSHTVVRDSRGLIKDIQGTIKPE